IGSKIMHPFGMKKKEYTVPRLSSLDYLHVLTSGSISLPKKLYLYPISEGLSVPNLCHSLVTVLF
ncbi:hypothetical protein ACJX0J_016765, partial [Zea mays]